MRQLVAFQKFVGVRGDHVAGDKQKSFPQWIPGADQGLVEMLAIEFWHLHIANHKVVGFAFRAAESFPSVQQNVDLQSFVLQDITNQATDGGLVLDYQNLSWKIKRQAGYARYRR